MIDYGPCFGVSTKEAEDTVNLWYSDRPEVRSWQEVQHKNAASKGKVSTLLGRHRNLPDASSKDEGRRQHALRASINTPIQAGRHLGTGASGYGSMGQWVNSWGGEERPQSSASASSTTFTRSLNSINSLNSLNSLRSSFYPSR